MSKSSSGAIPMVQPPTRPVIIEVPPHPDTARNEHVAMSADTVPTFGSFSRQQFFGDLCSEEEAAEFLDFLLEAKRNGKPLGQEVFDFVVHPLLERVFPYESVKDAVDELNTRLMAYHAAHDSFSVSLKNTE